MLSVRVTLWSSIRPSHLTLPVHVRHYQYEVQLYRSFTNVIRAAIETFDSCVTLDSTTGPSFMTITRVSSTKLTITATPKIADGSSSQVTFTATDTFGTKNSVKVTFRGQ